MTINAMQYCRQKGRRRGEFIRLHIISKTKMTTSTFDQMLLDHFIMIKRTSKIK